MTPATLEKAVAETAADTTKSSLKLAETAVKKAWTLMEAAVEKQSPTEYLSEKGIRAMQGKLTDK
jgi:phage/plasmid primase-like uncharacterized protein